MALSPLGPDEEIITTDDAGLDVLPLRTYAINFDTGEIGGIVDGTDAIKQFIYKAILTARYRFPIYDSDYGCEIEDLIGSDASIDLLETEVPRVITEALIYDDRISDVYDFTLTREGDRLYVSFFVDVDEETIPMEVTI
ncbi:DUF2634 domain-containing protein [Neobacillus mesonae]|nr:DUF2634 domain-containing protein [Neobacillus mesonae]